MTFWRNKRSGREKKINNAEQPVSLEPFTTLFNRLFEEIISEKLCKWIIRKCYDVSNPQNAIIAPELTSYNTYVKRIDLKQKLLKCFQKTFLRGTMKRKKYCLIKKTLSLSLAGNIVSKLTKGLIIRKQETIWYYKTASKH